MSTRHVKTGERRTQNGWASAPEYDVLRGLNGTAVAFKAALQDDPQKCELLFFLQALSLRDGGVKRIAREVVEMFPERIGTPTMLKIGCKPGKRLSRAQYDAIYDEMGHHCSPEKAREIIMEMFAPDCTDDFLDEQKPKPKPQLAPVPTDAADAFINKCQEECKNLDGFIEDLCCNPRVEVARAGDGSISYRSAADIAIQERADIEDGQRGSFISADLYYFDDILGALFEYKRRHEAKARAEFVETSIGKIVFGALDYMLEAGKPVLVEGKSGFGKSTGEEAWCEMHLGRARYIKLTGITTRTQFFRKLAKAFGVANGGGMTAGKVQSRVEEFLQRTKLMLVIDEGQYLWPQGKRIESHPELINWLNTACYNEGVPFAIFATEQFTKRRQHVEAQTDWESWQSRRRTRGVFKLPDKPTTDDLRKVAIKRLADVGITAQTAVDRVVGYALTSQGYFQTITDVIDDARLIARRDGREQITYADLRSAIDDWRAPSDAALQRVFETKPETRRRGPRRTSPESVIQESCTTLSDGVNNGAGTEKEPKIFVRNRTGQEANHSRAVTPAASGALIAA